MFVSALALSIPLGGFSACSSAKPPPPPVATVPITPSASSGTDGHASTTPDDVPPEEAAKQQRRIARMLKKVSGVRGLESKKEVPGRTLTRERLLAKVKEHVAREVPPEA